MSNKYLLVAIGMKCPKPLIEVHKAMKEIDVGQTLEVHANDPAFKLDIEAWCRRTGNPLLELEKTGDVFVAKIKKIA
jgi:tRNA 2-thiouridine synthesizing protein A